MDLAEGIATFEGRLATFEQTQQLPKRRASNGKKKNQTPHAASWPHSTPTPDQLARAGFYYKPTEEHEDSVTCFLCGKALDGWEPDDIPALEHFAKVPDCGWAINVCIEQRVGDMGRAEADPLSAEMIEARKATFQNYWPHEKKRGWKCKTKKMVDAGWCYNPVPEGEDCVKCFYCGLTLDGWEPKDDPLEEHRRREPECPFFALVDEYKKDRKTKGRGKGRGVRASQASSRASTQSNATVASEVPSFTSLDNFDLPGDDVDEGDTMMTSVSTQSKTTGGKTGKRKGAATKGSKRAKRGPKATAEDSSTVQEELATLEDQEIAASETGPLDEPLTRGRGRQSKRNTGQSVQSVGEASDLSQLGPSKTKATRTRGRKAARDEEVDHDAIGSLDEPNNTEQGTKRGKKRTSDGRVKTESSVLQAEAEHISEAAEEVNQDVDDTKPRAKASKSKAKTTRKPTAQKKAPKGKDESHMTDPDGTEVMEEAVEVKNSTVKKTKTKKPTVEIAEVRQEVDEEHLEIKDSQESGQRVEDAKAESVEAKDSQARALTPTQDMAQQVVSPAQSSDAENQPPSSRPSKQSSSQNAEEVEDEKLKKASTERIPLGLSTPAASPSKRNKTIGGLISEHAWTAIDLETAFLASPASKRAGQDGGNVEEILQQFTSPEKHMSVEEWILWRAQNAEGQLKEECERLIGTFESEGVRALRSIEGISCV